MEPLARMQPLASRSRARAIPIAHRSKTFEATFPAPGILAAAWFFPFHGAGKPSVVPALSRR
jgi:hypothetical protein